VRNRGGDARDGDTRGERERESKHHNMYEETPTFTGLLGDGVRGFTAAGETGRRTGGHRNGLGSFRGETWHENTRAQQPPVLRIHRQSGNEQIVCTAVLQWLRAAESRLYADREARRSNRGQLRAVSVVNESPTITNNSARGNTKQRGRISNNKRDAMAKMTVIEMIER
jgi:hypothetical protein